MKNDWLFILSVRVYYCELVFICGIISSVQDPVTGDEISVYPAIRRFFKMSGSFSVMLFMVRSLKYSGTPAGLQNLAVLRGLFGSLRKPRR